MPTLRRAPRSEAARAHVDAGADVVDKGERETPEKPRERAVEKTTPKRRSGGDEEVAATPAKDGAASASAEPAASAARIPTLVQFPLVAAISFTTASLGYSVVAELTKAELAGVSRSQETWEEIGILAGWRM